MKDIRELYEAYLAVDAPSYDGFGFAKFVYLTCVAECDTALDERDTALDERYTALDERDELAARLTEAESEFELRADGKRVLKARWEYGMRRIVALLWGNRHEFEIDDVVEAVRKLVPNPHTDDEALADSVFSAQGDKGSK